MYKTMVLIGILVLSAILPVQAAPVGSVSGLQTPAWLEREGGRLPLEAGQVLQETDTLETGKSGRLLIQLSDGSLLKMGEQARLSLSEWRPAQTQEAPLRGLLTVLRGAFRFTTGTVAKTLAREIDVRVASITVGIRGTDIWGRSDNQADLVCLLEGKVSVQHAQAGSLMMDQPLMFFSAPKDAAPPSLAPVDPKKLEGWAAETELNRGQGVLVPQGGWLVQLAAHTREATAQRMAKQLRTAGYPADVSSAKHANRIYYRVRVGRFDTEADAQVFANSMREKFSVRKPWVTCVQAGGACN